MKPESKINRYNRYLEELNRGGFTTQPVMAGNCADVMPEFGRCQDVQRLFGIKRGTLYQLVADGYILSVSLRRRGRAKGCRLYYLQSISQYLHGLMTDQNSPLVDWEI